MGDNNILDLIHSVIQYDNEDVELRLKQNKNGKNATLIKKNEDCIEYTNIKENDYSTEMTQSRMKPFNKLNDEQKQQFLNENKRLTQQEKADKSGTSQGNMSIQQEKFKSKKLKTNDSKGFVIDEPTDTDYTEMQPCRVVIKRINE